MTVLVNSMRGLGDNIYQRPFVKMLAKHDDVMITTPWPELYGDIENVRFMRSDTTLRTQQKNILRQSRDIWSSSSGITRTINPVYAHEFERVGITRALEKQFDVSGDFIFDLPPTSPATFKTSRPIAVVRPVTERREWASKSRNPRPEYIADAARVLMETHHVISIADVDDGNEWFVGDVPPSHEQYHGGELTIDRLLSLVSSADVVVGGVGFITPMSIAAGVRSYCILGGRGAHNAPSVITDSRMDLSRIGWATPDNYCMCNQSDHECDKTIANFTRGFESWLKSVS